MLLCFSEGAHIIMLKWNEYIEELAHVETTFQGIDFSFGDGRVIDGTPPIIKTSILMLDKIKENMGRNNIIVFPEKAQSSFLFMVMTVLHNIAEGKISSAYDPTTFQKGQKLKLGNAVVEFQGLEEQDGRTLITLVTMDRGTPLYRKIPQSAIPHLQYVDTSRRISPNKKFSDEWKKIEGLINSKAEINSRLSALSGLKTHMDSSIIYVAPIAPTKAKLDNLEICDKKISEYILIGQADYEGTVSNVGAGQLVGIPPIVLASDLYSALAVVEQGHPVKEIIIDSNDINGISSQMDVIDDIIRQGKILTCVTDINGSFELNDLLLRGFNVWRWDECSITEELYDHANISLDKKTKNYATRNVENVKIDDFEASEILRLLSKHKNESKEQSNNLMQMYDRLFGLTFDLLREIVPYSDEDYQHIRLVAEECKTVLAEEQYYISEAFFEDCEKAIDLIICICDEKIVPPKVHALEEHLRSVEYKNICIIVSNYADKDRVKKYWQQWGDSNWQRKKINVLHPVEFLHEDCSNYEYVINAGWFNKSTMRSILYSCNVPQYCVLLYKCENGWQKSSTRIWNAAVKTSNNKTIVEKSFNTEKKKVSSEKFSVEDIAENDEANNDELYEIEIILRENKFRQYSASGKEINTIAEALPVHYSGGYLAFYKQGHKVISATKIITEDAENIETFPATNLQVGDFIVVRESDKDLIREMADIILAYNKKTEARNTAYMWKKAINDSYGQMSTEQICQKLIENGCKKGVQTIKNWITNEECIAPRQRDDLESIAQVTNDPLLKENIDAVYSAAQEVRTAHQQAGRNLSVKLRSRVAEAIEDYGDIDAFNFERPVELLVDGIGTVRVLKVIDIGTIMEVDASITNRLIEE